MYVVAEVLAEHDMLVGLSEEHPLNIAANGSDDISGLQSPFSQASYEASMAKTSECIAILNSFTRDWRYTANPGIALR
ncbi:MAG: hypothetical protein ACKPKO_02830, partial [Candidatus Fonsibacter sp.]